MSKTYCKQCGKQRSPLSHGWNNRRNSYNNPTGFCAYCMHQIKRLKAVCPNEYQKAVKAGLIEPI